jgi:Pvc16 N-terminal domain
MLDLAIRFLADEVNTHLKKRALTGTNIGEVIVGQLVDDAGKWAIAPDNIGMTVVNIEEDRVMRSQLPEYAYVDGSHVLLQPGLKLNLTVLFHARPSAGPGKYEQSLRFLSNLLTFFQAHPVFTPDEYPALDPRFDKLLVEMVALTTEQLNQIWAYLGSKYLPSVAYRVRMVVLQDVEPSGIGKPITGIETVLANK